jgi:hypothetical protein
MADLSRILMPMYFDFTQKLLVSNIFTQNQNYMMLYSLAKYKNGINKNDNKNLIITFEP